ncbi:MAG TPA: hypothetical protein VFW19_01205 [Allosphingosinicella sp.]|nr:hypothetical protein [Allosphingosinicella sp.]
MSLPGGYVRVHRSLIGHPAFRNDAEAMAFAWLICRAAWQPVELRYKGRLVRLGRGQLALSVRDFAAAMDRDKGWAERLLRRLRARAMVETAKGPGSLIISICNYGRFQADEGAVKTARRTAGGTAAGRGRDTEQGIEQGEEGIPPSAPKGARAARASNKHALPDDWQLPAIESLTDRARACAALWSRASYEAVGEAFVCYWRRTGRRNVDWRLTFCGWVLREHEKVMRSERFGAAPPAAGAAPRTMGAEERASLAALHQARETMAFDDWHRLRQAHFRRWPSGEGRREGGGGARAIADALRPALRRPETGHGAGGRSGDGQSAGQED